MDPELHAEDWLQMQRCLGPLPEPQRGAVASDLYDGKIDRVDQGPPTYEIAGTWYGLRGSGQRAFLQHRACSDRYIKLGAYRK